MLVTIKHSNGRADETVNVGGGAPTAYMAGPSESGAGGYQAIYIRQNTRVTPPIYRHLQDQQAHKGFSQTGYTFAGWY